MEISTLRWMKVPLLSVAMAVLFGGSVARGQTAGEYELKAAFLFNFAQFVDWPARAFADASSPLVIGVLGDDPFHGALERATQGETINKRKLLVSHYRRIEDAKTCHILFISKSENGRLTEILSSLRGTNILTVGDAEQLARRGGIIDFTMEGNKVRFEINVEAARRAELKVSSKLLKLGKIVG